MTTSLPGEMGARFGILIVAFLLGVAAGVLWPPPAAPISLPATFDAADAVQRPCPDPLDVRVSFQNNYATHVDLIGRDRQQAEVARWFIPHAGGMQFCAPPALVWTVELHP